MQSGIIKQIRAYEILTGNGKPTVEVELTTDTHHIFTASVPSGTSKGGYEAFELVDGGSRYKGKGSRKAVANVNQVIAPALIGQRLTDPEALDRLLIALDGTSDKHILGGNAILPVSAAIYKAAAANRGIPLYELIGGSDATHLPAPMATVIAGGAFSDSPLLDFEDFICVASEFDSFADALEAIVRVRSTLEDQLKTRFNPVLETGGALACALPTNEGAIEAILKSIETCGYTGRMQIGLDVAANELYDLSSKMYQVKGQSLSVDELIDYYANLCEAYPISFIEDGLEENDYQGFSNLKARIDPVLVVGDDLYASNKKRLMQGIEYDATSAILLKINQIGTITEAIETAQTARLNQQVVIVSLRSNDTCDPFIADLAVGVGASMIKLGSPVRGERVAKYNRLLSIEDQLLNPDK